MSPDELLHVVMRMELFRGLNPTTLHRLRVGLSEVRLESGERLFEQGEQVDAIFCVISGRLEVLIERRSQDPLVIASVTAGETVGEMQILSGGTRTATLRAVEPTVLVRLEKPTFDQFLADDSRVLQQIARIILPRLYRDQLLRLLPRLFGPLDQVALSEMERQAEWVRLPRGEILFGQGDAPDGFYLLVSGRLQVMVTDGPGQYRFPGQVAQGESVGEMGAYSGEPRSATLIAVRDCELVRFSQPQFDHFIQQYPAFLRHLTELLIGRLSRTSRTRSRGTLSKNLSLIPASGDGDLDRFAHELRIQLERFASCLYLTSERVDALLGRPGLAQAREGTPDDLRLRAWLNEQETHYQFLVLLADRTVTPWSVRCIREADMLLQVGSGLADPALSAVEEEILRQQEANRTTWNRSLVLLHSPSVKRPNGTSRWLALRKVQHHFHLRETADYERLARFLADRQVGLVLSGGGARGFAHVGVIRAMEQIDIPIDRIGGVSMGAVLAALYASYDTFHDQIPFLKKQLKGVMSDYTLPLISLARGRRLNRRLQRIFGNLQLEDLWRPCFLVSSNLTRGQIVVHRTGPVWRAVRASSSLPGIVTPVIDNGDLLYDGCLLNNLPMDVMRDDVGDGAVVAVDVVPPVDLQVVSTPVEAPSGWQILWSWFNPFGKRIQLPDIFSIIQRAGQIGCVQARQQMIDQNLADLYLRPPVEPFEIMDFDAVDQTARIGYEFAHPQLSHWWPTWQSSP
jgi:predicted acylesterase/phospholipase RssA/CRP-like cAMP-binding protein